MSFVASSQHVIPISMEFVASEIERGHFLVGHNNSLRVVVGIQFAPYGQSGFGGRGADQIDNHPIVDRTCPVTTAFRVGGGIRYWFRSGR